MTQIKNDYTLALFGAIRQFWKAYIVIHKTALTLFL